MPMSAVCGRINRIPDIDASIATHGDCGGTLRYLDPKTGVYFDDRCACDCHVEKREWYLSDFGPGPHEILWISDRQIRG
jgi:hypothetical protein